VAEQYQPHAVGKQAHLPELIADGLRKAIVNGELEDGSLLPNQDELSERFGVSKPTLREAVRILHAEHLLSTRRGKLGGAIVHRPTVKGAAYTLGLLLQGQGTPQSDVLDALSMIEPRCVALCAQRKDRAKTVVPVLRKAVDELVDELAAHEEGSAASFLRAERLFHNELVGRCGSPTLAAVVGTLEELWGAQQWAEIDIADQQGVRRNIALRKHVLESHEEILKAVEAGDAELAAQHAEQHLKRLPYLKTLITADQPVQVTRLFR
jgi:GntR family transcriptional regulator, transcriptional repressor for pyruvate dehydrogenase complex